MWTAPFGGSSLYEGGKGVDRPHGILSLSMSERVCVCVCVCDTKPCGVYNNNVDLSCTHQRPEGSHDTY